MHFTSSYPTIFTTPIFPLYHSNAEQRSRGTFVSLFHTNASQPTLHESETCFRSDHCELTANEITTVSTEQRARLTDRALAGLNQACSFQASSRTYRQFLVRLAPDTSREEIFPQSRFTSIRNRWKFNCNSWSPVITIFTIVTQSRCGCWEIELRDRAKRLCKAKDQGLAAAVWSEVNWRCRKTWMGKYQHTKHNVLTISV